MEAFDVENGKIVFLKNRWRADLDGIYKEGEAKFTCRCCLSYSVSRPDLLVLTAKVMRITYSQIINGL